MDWEKRLEKAKRTNAARDAVDRAHEFATPAQFEPLTHLATAVEAIRAGGKLEDWDCVAEGVVMLEDLLERLRRR